MTLTRSPGPALTSPRGNEREVPEGARPLGGRVAPLKHVADLPRRLQSRAGQVGQAGPMLAGARSSETPRSVAGAGAAFWKLTVNDQGVAEGGPLADWRVALAGATIEPSRPGGLVTAVWPLTAVTPNRATHPTIRHLALRPLGH